MRREYAFTVLQQIPQIPDTKAQMISSPAGEDWVLKFVIPFSVPAGGNGAMFVWAKGEGIDDTGYFTPRR
jgi:hypothetical protein